MSLDDAAGFGLYGVGAMSALGYAYDFLTRDHSKTQRNIRNNINAITQTIRAIPRAIRSAAGPFSSGMGNAFATPSSLSIASASVDLGKVFLRDPGPWIKRASDANAEAKRTALELGIDVIPQQLVKSVSYWKFALGDNQQGRCKWFCYPVLNPSELDQYALKNTDDLRTPLIATQLNYISVEFLFRCAGAAKADIDVWLLWPHRDIPTNADIKFDDGTTTYPLTDGWYYGVDPPFMKYGFAPAGTTDASGTYIAPTVANTNVDWKVSPMPYNDWLATPQENQYIMDNFDVEYHGHRKFNPGDECTYVTGVPNQLIFPFDQIELDMGSETKVVEAFKKTYALMRRCGPLVLFRMRGGLSHLEPAGSSTTPTLGLFSFDMALIRADNTNPVPAGFAASMVERGVYTAFKPSDQGQGTAATTHSFFQTELSDHPFTT